MKDTHYTHILWDFNGTILDDVDAGIASINALLSRRHLPLLADRDAYRQVFGFPIVDYYRRVGLPIDTEGFDALAVEWVKESDENLQTLKLYDGIGDLLSLFARAGYCQQILSACEVNQLGRQLQDLGIASYFERIVGSDNIYGRGKIGAAHCWREEHPTARALLFGDTVHDFEVAKEIGTDCILIAAGHQDAARLATLGVPVFPDAVTLYEHFVKFSQCFG